MKKTFPRRQFIRTATFAGIGATLLESLPKVYGSSFFEAEAKVGIIGLDTSHAIAFTKALNAAEKAPALKGFRVVAAYPKGSADIESSVKRIPGYIEEVKKLGVEIVDSEEELLKKVDYVFLETNDGRPHLAQAMKVIKAKKPFFIDKPVAASLTDTLAIYAAAKQNNVPVFSSSSLRYMESVQDVIKGKVGTVLGADTFSPAALEKTHPDFFWYGIHGIEMLFAIMGPGCKEVSRVHTNDTDIVVGTWKDGRVGTFRGMRTGTHDYGGTVYGNKGNLSLGPFKGYDNLLVQILEFFRTGKSPINVEETMDIYAFMEAADESKRKGGATVSLEAVVAKAKRK